MKTLYLAIILVLTAVCIYLFITRGDSEIVIGPSQRQLDEFKRDAERKQNQLAVRLDSAVNAHRHDSTMRVQKIKSDGKVIKRLNDMADSLLAAITDTTSCCEASEIKSSVIAIKQAVIERQAERILNDSIFIKELYDNFNARIAIVNQGSAIKDSVIVMQDKRIDGLESKIKRKNKGQVVLGGIVLGLLVLIGLN